jgi:hypothetical protein
MIVTTSAQPVSTALQPPNQPLAGPIFLQARLVIQLESKVQSTVEWDVTEDRLVGIMSETRIFFQSLVVIKVKRELVCFVPGVAREQDVGERRRIVGGDKIND